MRRTLRFGPLPYHARLMQALVVPGASERLMSRLQFLEITYSLWEAAQLPSLTDRVVRWRHRACRQPQARWLLLLRARKM